MVAHTGRPRVSVRGDARTSPGAPRSRRWLRLVSLFVAGALSACGGEEERAAPSGPSVSSAVMPTTTTDFASAEWTAPADGEAVVARVNGAPITAATLRVQLEAHPGVGAVQLLDRLIEVEVAAQDAQRRGLGRAPEVARTYRQALVQAWLREVFVAGHGPEEITADQVRGIYSIPSVRQRYDHAPAWRMAYLMFTCCDPKSEDCGQPEVLECFQAAAIAAQTVYQELEPRVAPVAGDPTAVARIMEDYRKEMEVRWPQLSYREKAFFYDPDKPHAEQKGYNIYAEAVARTVIEAPTGVLQPPVESTFGWHLLVKLDHEPERRQGPDDPEVMADIRANAFPKFQEAIFLKELEVLRHRAGVTTHPELLARLP